MFQQLLPQLKCGFSTKIDGNLALHVGDVPEHVIANRIRFAEAAGFSFDTWTCAEQVHGAKVAIVDASMIGAGRENVETALRGYDGLVTNVPGVMLASFYADCVPLYFVDVNNHVIGLAHAGWKGTVANIVEEMIRLMTSEFGSSLGDIHAAIGPSIGSCCYEVDDVVINGINNVLQEEVYPPGKAHVDLKEINRQIMIRTGILPNQIEVSNHCTSCRTDLYYSYRAEQGRTGRMASWIGLTTEA
jgi:YfiH family protein